jgi:hypothetical protein
MSIELLQIPKSSIATDDPKGGLLYWGYLSTLGRDSQSSARSALERGLGYRYRAAGVNARFGIIRQGLARQSKRRDQGPGRHRMILGMSYRGLVALFGPFGVKIER